MISDSRRANGPLRTYDDVVQAIFRATLSVAAGLTFVACSAGGDSKGPPPPAFVDRLALPSCGETAAKDPSSILGDLYPQSAMDCLTISRNDNGAEFAVTVLTTEGDPINTFYRTAGNSSTVEIFLDKSGDRYGGGDDWVQISCEVPILSADALRSCSANY